MGYKPPLRRFGCFGTVNRISLCVLPNAATIVGTTANNMNQGKTGICESGTGDIFGAGQSQAGSWLLKDGWGHEGRFVESQGRPVMQSERATWRHAQNSTGRLRKGVL